MDRLIGSKWKIERDLGEGGQGRTFIVVDPDKNSDTRYVLKKLKSHTGLGRFKKEVQAVKMLNHPNILKLIDYNLDIDDPFMVTEYCEGGNLQDAKPFWINDPVCAIDLFLQICDGIAYAHSKSVIHRDIKPKNIFLRTSLGPTVVGDFGICYIDEGGLRITLTDEPVGARFFIAPELEDGRGIVTTKADSYSLGKLLYWLLSGGKLFSREKHREVEYDLKGRNDDRITKWNNIYMEHINRVLDLMINDKPEKRREVENIILCIRDAKKLYTNRYNPVGGNIPQPCYYCGEGIYISQIHNPSDVGNFGINVVGPADWKIYVCNYCGHVQLFRYDKAKPPEWWKE